MDRRLIANRTLEDIMEKAQPNSLVDHLCAYILECEGEMSRQAEELKKLQYNLGCALESKKRVQTIMQQLHAQKAISTTVFTRLRQPLV